MKTNSSNPAHLPLLVLLIVLGSSSIGFFFLGPSNTLASQQHVTDDDYHPFLIPPRHYKSNSNTIQQIRSNITLREYLTTTSETTSKRKGKDGSDDGGIYLAMGPSFFGFYGYFGALMGIESSLFDDETKKKNYKHKLISVN